MIHNFLFFFAVRYKYFPQAKIEKHTKTEIIPIKLIILYPPKHLMTNNFYLTMNRILPPSDRVSKECKNSRFVYVTIYGKQKAINTKIFFQI